MTPRPMSMSTYDNCGYCGFRFSPSPFADSFNSRRDIFLDYLAPVKCKRKSDSVPSQATLRIAEGRFIPTADRAATIVRNSSADNFPLRRIVYPLVRGRDRSLQMHRRGLKWLVPIVNSDSSQSPRVTAYRYLFVSLYGPAYESSHETSFPALPNRPSLSWQGPRVYPHILFRAPARIIVALLVNFG